MKLKGGQLHNRWNYSQSPVLDITGFDFSTSELRAATFGYSSLLVNLYHTGLIGLNSSEYTKAALFTQKRE